MGIAVIFRKFLVLFWAFLLATAAVAGEEHRTKIEIAIDDDDSGHQSFKFDSKDAGFNLHDTDGAHVVHMSVDGDHGRHEVRIIRKEVDVTN